MEVLDNRPRKKHPKLPVKKHRPRARWNYFTGSYTKRDMRPLKPERFREHMTITELAQHTGKDYKWLLRLEKLGRIPQASRFQKGTLQWRLWSPEQVEEIVEILKHHRVGRPRKNGNPSERVISNRRGKLHVAEINIDDIFI